MMVKWNLKKKDVMPGTKTAHLDANRSKLTPNSSLLLTRMQQAISAHSRALVEITPTKVGCGKDAGISYEAIIY